MSRKERRARARHAQQMNDARMYVCPTPGKHPFPDSDVAVAAMVRHGFTVKDGWAVYHCACGWWHLTSKGGGRLFVEQYSSAVA